MGRSGYTTDESFLIKLYEEALSGGDMELEIDFLDLGRSLRQKDRAIKTIVRDLAQANFVKKVDDSKLILTPNGITLAQKFKEGWIG